MRVKSEIKFRKKYLVEFKDEKYNLSYKSQFYKIKTMILTSTNAHL